jgi:hypothetical protein
VTFCVAARQVSTKRMKAIDAVKRLGPVEWPYPNPTPELTHLEASAIERIEAGVEELFGLPPPGRFARWVMAPPA